MKRQAVKNNHETIQKLSDMQPKTEWQKYTQNVSCVYTVYSVVTVYDIQRLLKQVEKCCRKLKLSETFIAYAVAKVYFQTDDKLVFSKHYPSLLSVVENFMYVQMYSSNIHTEQRICVARQCS